METQKLRLSGNRGFALVVTLTLMVLLTLLVVGMLSLSAVSLRGDSRKTHLADARANARLALMVAIGELQKEMGPDMRVSAESALLDTVEATEKIEGVEQSRWLGSYDSWGAWLNAEYTPPGGSQLTIQDTYGKGRSPMFRRWLLSLPEGLESDSDAPRSLVGIAPERLAIMVGEGSLGNRAASDPDQVTKAYLVEVGDRGRYAWWISPENHRAKVTLAKQPRSLQVAEWEAGQGDTAEVGVGALDGFGFLESGADLSPKLVTNRSMEVAGVERSDAQQHFFDLTAHGKGVLASVRTGRLKKDLGLLFEKPNSELPDEYRYDAGDTQEPSIRPMSPDLLAKNPRVTNRHFASWTNLMHFYRMYREISDSTGRGTGASHSLEWAGTVPQAKAQIPLLYRDQSNANQWHGNDSYFRLPVLAKLTFIYSLKTERVNPASTTDLRYRLYLVYTPVFTYWNPYNTELRIPDNTMGSLSSTYQVLPMHMQFYLGNNAQSTEPTGLSTSNAHSFLRSGDGSDIVFKPGEIRLFSHTSIKPQGNQFAPEDLMPMFDPMAYGGDRLQIAVRNESENPGLTIFFGHSIWGGNVGYGNTAGSLCHTPFWLPQGKNRDLAYNWNYPVMYQNDWFNLAQTYTPMTPDPSPSNGVATRPDHINRWVFSDSDPVPIGYAQLVLKGSSEFSYESIDWARDWRCRNWIQSPPFYFGSSLYISEDDDIAHTQRLDNPYVMNFGPMTSAEMPKVVGHIGRQAFLGSGSNPFEQVTAVAALELPSAPLTCLAGFSGMRINPGWVNPLKLFPNQPSPGDPDPTPTLSVESTGGNTTPKRSFYYSLNKTIAYQSGVTGPGIGNSFMHPMLPSNDVYRFFNNSVSADPNDRSYPLVNITYNNNKVFCDYWDHVFLLNDALWDDYFVSSLAHQTRPSASAAKNLEENLDRLVADDQLPNSRYKYHASGKSPSEVKSELQDTEGYLKAAGHLMVDGMFNVNSTSVDAWFALFAGIRERKAVFRDANGALKEISVPADKRIALTRFNTEVSDKEMEDPETGEPMPDGSPGWSGVRFLGDDELEKLAEECVKQVKLRGPFLNFSEFVNRRLSDDKLGTMGALQSAIDYDDASPESGSINYRFKNGPDFMLKESDLSDPSGTVNHNFATPEAAEGSRFAGIPGYVIQSDLLKPLANTLSVRDDTFRIRACGESLDANGNVVARAWCEAIVQRYPEYCDGVDPAETSVRGLDADGSFEESGQLSGENLRFGRRFQIESFRWLSENEI